VKTVHVLWCRNLPRYARHPGSMRKLQKQNTDFGNGAPTLGLHPILSTLGTTGYTLGLDLRLWNPAWVTQPPWLHQFCFRWTIAHPITKPGAVTEVQAHFSFLARPSRDFFLHPWTQLPHSKKMFHLPVPLLMLWTFFSKLSFFLPSLSLLQWCHHPLPSLMFREELGVAVTSRCEQCKVQHFEEDTKTKYVFYIFFCTCDFMGLGLWDLFFAYF